MSSGTILWVLLLVVGPLLMVFMHRGHGGHGSHGGGPAGPATAPADPRTKAGDDSSVTPAIVPAKARPSRTPAPTAIAADTIPDRGITR